MDTQNAKSHIRKLLGKETLQRYISAIRSLKRGFDEMRDHAVITDPDANIIYANKAVEKNTGFSIPEIIGKNPADL